MKNKRMKKQETEGRSALCGFLPVFCLIWPHHGKGTRTQLCFLSSTRFHNSSRSRTGRSPGGCFWRWRSDTDVWVGETESFNREGSYSPWVGLKILEFWELLLTACEVLEDQSKLGKDLKVLENWDCSTQTERSDNNHASLPSCHFWHTSLWKIGCFKIMRALCYYSMS